MASLAAPTMNNNNNNNTNPILDSLQNVLLAALSPDRDTQKNAEKQINETMKQEHGYGHALIMISIDQNRPVAARHIALTVLKRYISEAWLFVLQNEKKAFHPDEKNAIKDLAVKGLGAEVEVLRTGFGMVVAEIAGFDWPDQWPTLFDQINAYIHSGQENYVRGAIKCLSLFSDFLDEKTLPFIGPMLFPTLGKILTERQTFDTKLRMQAGKIVHSAVDEFLMKKDNNKAFQDLMVQVLPMWINDIFLPELDSQLCINFGVTELGIQIQFVRTLKAILKDCMIGLLNEKQIIFILDRITQCFHSYADLHQKYVVSPSYLNQNPNQIDKIWSDETEFQDDDGNLISLQMILVEFIGLYIDTLRVGEGKIRKITRAYVFQIFSNITKTVISAMYINGEQMTDWEGDIETYMLDEARYDEMKRTTGPRDEGRMFFECVADLFTSDIVLAEMTDNQIPYYVNLARQRRENIYGNNKGDEDWWKPIEALLVSFGTVSKMYKETKKKDDTGNNNTTESGVNKETLSKINASGLQDLILKQVTTPINKYLTATALWVGNTMSPFHTKESRRPFLNGMVQALSPSAPFPIRITACRQMAILYSKLDQEDKQLIAEPAVMAISNLCLNEDTKQGTLNLTLSTLKGLIEEIENPEILGKLEPTISTVMLKKWEQAGPVGGQDQGGEFVVFLIVDVIATMATSPLARMGLQQRLLPPMFHLLQTREQQVGGNIGASLEVFQHVIGNSTPPLASAIITEVFPIVCELVGTADDNAIIINATNCLTCFVRLCINNELNQNFNFRNAANNNVTTANGIEAILNVTFRLLDVSNESMQDQGLESVGHLVYHLVSNMKDILGDGNILKLLQFVILRMAKARYSSCINNLLTCILKLINKFGQIIINALKFDCGVLKLKNPITGEIQEKKHTLLSTFLTIWNYHDPDLLEGMYMVRLSVRMMGKLILLRDPDIENVVVDGDEIINVNEGRRTRSSKKKINYQQVPWPLRAFQSMARRVDDPRDDGGAKDDFGDTFGGDDMLMMQQFAKEGGLLGDDGVFDDNVEDDMFAKYDLSDMIGDNGKSIFDDFDRAGGLSAEDDLLYEMEEMKDECRNDISAIGDEFYQVNVQVETREFLLNLLNSNSQMFDHCAKTLDTETRENLNAAVEAYQLNKNMNAKQNGETGGEMFVQNDNNNVGVVEQKM